MTPPSFPLPLIKDLMDKALEVSTDRLGDQPEIVVAFRFGLDDDASAEVGELLNIWLQIKLTRVSATPEIFRWEAQVSMQELLSIIDGDLVSRELEVAFEAGWGSPGGFTPPRSWHS